MSPATLIVGVGSPHGDDQAGWRVAEAAAGRLRDGASSGRVALRLIRSPSELLDLVDGLQWLIICDACRAAGAAPGTIHRWQWPEPQLRAATWSGTHDWGLCPALELCQQLGRLPPQVTIWGVAADTARPGAAMSPPVAAAVTAAAQQLAGEVAHKE
jgi:hydrogenase maturation protease